MYLSTKKIDLYSIIIFVALSLYIFIFDIISIKKFSILLILLFVVIYYFHVLNNRPIDAIFPIILLIPLLNLSVLSGRLIPLPGFSLKNIFCLLMMFLWALNFKRITLLDSKILVKALLLWLVITLAVLVSTLDVGFVNYISTESGFQAQWGFIRDELVRPLLLWSLVLLLPLLIRDRQEFKKLYTYILVSMIVFSVIILSANAYYFNIHSSYQEVRSQVNQFIGIHANDYGVMFTLIIPVILGFLRYTEFNQRKMKNISYLALICSLLTIMFSYSRSCYVVALFSIIMFYLYANKAKLIKYVFPFLMLLIIFSPQSIENRVQYGLETGSSNLNYDKLSAGRFQMWDILFNEYSDNWLDILIGNGRYSTAKSKYRHVLPGHPHNAYLEVLFDTGIVGLFVFILFYLEIFKKIHCQFKINKNTEYEHYYFGFLLMFVSYLIIAISGRSFFPDIRFTYFWILIGLFLYSIKSKYMQSELEKQ